MIKLSEKWTTLLKEQPETGMSYQIATIYLKDGRSFKQSVITGDVLTKVRGCSTVPFEEVDIARIEVTHEKWDW